MIKQSLERIDNAVKRYGDKINPKEMPSAFELSNKIQLQQLRDYLESEEASCPEDYMSKRTMLDSVQTNKKQVFSENITNSVV